MVCVSWWHCGQSLAQHCLVSPLWLFCQCLYDWWQEWREVRRSSRCSDHRYWPKERRRKGDGLKKKLLKKKSVFWWTYLESSVQYCLITLSKNIHFTAIQCQVLHTIHNSGEKELTMYKTHRKPEECYSHSSQSAFWRKYLSLFFSHLLTSLLWTLVLTNSAEDY